VDQFSGGRSEIERLNEQLQADYSFLQDEIKLTHDFENIIGNSNELKYVLHKVEQVAPSATTVLILGEIGTGKELIARALHSASPRQHRLLIKVYCASPSPTLIESELFGHEKGAFTGAQSRKIGRFELAHGSTIFLDEVRELPLELQTKLLRVVQEGEFEGLGSSQPMKVDVRIIAATNRDLKSVLLVKPSRKAGIEDFTFHDLRHTAINNWRLQGNDYFRIMAASGHKTMHVFKRYNTVSKEELRALVMDKNGSL
jgi:transcriptional regulator with GAF, ATPase, and Fis domain